MKHFLFFFRGLLYFLALVISTPIAVLHMIYLVGSGRAVVLEKRAPFPWYQMAGWFGL